MLQLFHCWIEERFHDTNSYFLIKKHCNKETPLQANKSLSFACKGVLVYTNILNLYQRVMTIAE